MGVVGLTPPQGMEWLVILAVLVLLFGAKKLPELGSSVGRTITSFKKGVAEGKEEDGDEQAAASDPVESGSEERRAPGS